MPPTFPRTALVLSVLCAFSVNAAAQSDAAFAAAAGQRVSFKSVDLFKKAQKPAGAKPFAADDAVWKKVIETVKRDGKYTPEKGLMPGSFSIEDSSGDPKADHVKQSVTFLGMLNDDDKFEAMGAIFVFMEYKLDPKDGNWRIDQWMIQTDVYGAVENAGHGTMIQSADGKTVSAAPEKLSSTDPRIKTRLDAELKHWAERAPKGA